MVDLEILSPRGEMSKLLAQFAALLLLLSWLFSVPSCRLRWRRRATPGTDGAHWSAEHLLIATSLGRLPWRAAEL